MESRDQQIYHEAAALWTALFGEPPPASLSATGLFDFIARRAPVATYESLRSPHLRPANITGPKPLQPYG